MIFVCHFLEGICDAIIVNIKRAYKIENQTVVFKCEQVSLHSNTNFRKTVSWNFTDANGNKKYFYSNGSLVDSRDGRITVNLLSDEEFMLRIGKLVPADNGVYKCVQNVSSKLFEVFVAATLNGLSE